jgi:hypothetical protein
MLQPCGLAGLKRVGSGPYQLPGVGVEEQQGGHLLRCNCRPGRPARISAASTTRCPSDTVPARATVRSTSRWSGSPGCSGPGLDASGGGPAGTAPWAARVSRSLTVNRDRSVLPSARGSTGAPLAVDPEPHPLAGPRVSQPELAGSYSTSPIASGRDECPVNDPLPGSQCGVGNGRTIAWPYDRLDGPRR